MTWEPLDWSLRKKIVRRLEREPKMPSTSTGWMAFDCKREPFRVPVCRSSLSSPAQKGRPWSDREKKARGGARSRRGEGREGEATMSNCSHRLQLSAVMPC